MRPRTARSQVLIAVPLTALILASCGSLGGSGDRAPSQASLADVHAGEDQPGGGIAWDEAANYAGTTQRVCGPFAGSGNSDNDVFLNLGRDYPDPERFQILIWGIGSVEPIAIGATVCASGEVALYNGVAEMVLESTELDRVEVYG